MKKDYSGIKKIHVKIDKEDIDKWAADIREEMYKIRDWRKQMASNPTGMVLDSYC